MYLGNLVVALFFILGTLPAYAAVTTVTNDISVSAQSGGNVVRNGGTVNTGHTSASVDLTTTVNGVRQIDVHEHATDTPIHIERSTTIDTATVTAATPALIPRTPVRAPRSADAAQPVVTHDDIAQHIGPVDERTRATTTITSLTNPDPTPPAAVRQRTPLAALSGLVLSIAHTIAYAFSHIFS